MAMQDKWTKSLLNQISMTNIFSDEKIAKQEIWKEPSQFESVKTQYTHLNKII